MDEGPGDPPAHLHEARHVHEVAQGCGGCSIDAGAPPSKALPGEAACKSGPTSRHARVGVCERVPEVEMHRVCH